MKKLTALLLTLVLALGIPATAFAAKDADGNETTTLTVTIPAPSYTLHVPADMTLKYGVTDFQEIGTVKVTDVDGFDDICVMPKYTDLVNTADNTDKLALSLYDKTDMNIGLSAEDALYQKNGRNTLTNGMTILFREASSTDHELTVKVPHWNGAAPGAIYKATITYVLEVTPSTK